jgi:hypothetical protein
MSKETLADLDEKVQQLILLAKGVEPEDLEEGLVECYTSKGDLLFPMPVYLASWRTVDFWDFEKVPIPDICWADITKADRALGVGRATSQNLWDLMGIFKSPKDELAGYVDGPVIKRGHEGFTYYMGELVPLLRAMVQRGVVSSLASDQERVQPDYRLGKVFYRKFKPDELYCSVFSEEEEVRPYEPEDY